MDLSKRFPFLSDLERELVFAFEQGKTNQADVVKLMLELSDNFRAASSTLERVAARAKLLGLAGLYEVIAVEKFDQAKNSPLSLTMLELQIENNEDPLQALIRCGEIPLDMILNFPGLREFFAIKRPDGFSYQSLLLKKQAEIGGVLVVMKSNINEEVSSYVSASSEPLTRCIVLNPWIDAPSREVRDYASMVFDLVMQIEFLKIFYNSKGVLNRLVIQAAMRLEGLRFVYDTFSVLLSRAIEGKHLEMEITSSEVLLRSKSGSAGLELCNYLNFILNELGLKTIEQLVQILGFQEAELEVGKILIEHHLNFDPRRLVMKII